jgi:hypothetical protein
LTCDNLANCFSQERVVVAQATTLRRKLCIGVDFAEIRNAHGPKNAFPLLHHISRIPRLHSRRERNNRLRPRNILLFASKAASPQLAPRNVWLLRYEQAIFS